MASILSALLIMAPAEQVHSTPDIKFGYLTACVADIELSTNFLSEVFSWQRFVKTYNDGTTEAAKSAREEWIDADGFTLHLLENSGNNGTQCENVGYPSLTFAASRLPEALNKLESGGLKPSVKPSNIPKVSKRLSVPEFAWPKEVTGQVDVRLQGETKQTTVQKSNVGRVSKPRVDRIAIIVRDSERAAKFFTDVLGLRRHPETVDLDGATNKQSGGIHVVFVDADGIWLALVQPVGPGPLNGYLDQQGDGVIAELIVEVPRIGDFYDLMSSKNAQLIDTSGEPVDPVAKAHILEPFRDKIAYFPPSITGGLTIELVERGDPATSLLERRDRGWIPRDKNNSR